MDGYIMHSTPYIDYLSVARNEVSYNIPKMKLLIFFWGVGGGGALI